MTQPFDPRQHMLAQSFEIFHYCDSKLDNVELHHHDFFEIYLFLSGNVDYSIESRIYHLLPGDMLLISPLELHQPRITQEVTPPYERIVLWINKAFLNQFSSPQTSLTSCFDANDPHHTNLLRFSPAQREIVQGLMLQLISEAGNRSYGGDLVSISILMQLLVEINRVAQTTIPKYESGDKAAMLVSNVLDYINEHYNEELSLDTIANKFFISKYHLSHEFNRLVGTSVYRYIVQKRLVIAKQMLSDGVPPTDAYQHCGFKDYANFYRAFKNTYDINPKKFAEISQGDLNPWQHT